MKKAFTLLLLLIITIAFIASDRHDKNQGDGIQPPGNYPLVVDSKRMDANTINTWFRNNGSFNRDPSTGNSGFEWPKGSSKFARYASGLWLGALVDGDTLIAMAEYDYEYLPGYTDANQVPKGSDDPAYKVYKITRNVNDADRAAWPNALLGNSDQGAPVYQDEAGNWKPLDLGYQTLYYVYTDSYPDAHGNNGGSTAPLNADIQQTNFAYNFGGPLGQIAFTQLKIINRSTKTWTAAYLSAWSDDDLGEATDDMVAVDTNLDLGYTYNADNADGVYGAAPPAVGFDFFRGAIIPTGNNADTAWVCEGNVRVGLAGFRQQGLNVFNWYFNGGPVWGDPSRYYETYRMLEGKGKLGQPIITPQGDTTTFFYSGDPVTGQGWISGPMAADDQRYMQSTGPFDMAPGDTQIIVIGQVIARGQSNLNSITQLRAVDLKAQQIYDNCFNVPAPPPSPNVTTYAPGNGKIYISWDDIAERSREFNLYNGSYYNFQGYNIYAIRPGTDGSEEDDRMLLATYDIKDGVKDIYDSIEVAKYNAIVYALVQRGYDNGIQRTYVLDRDPWGGGNLINGTPYCFSITAYSYDPNSGFSVGTPKVNESSVSASVKCVTPMALSQGTIVHYNFGDTIRTQRKDLGVLPLVVDPLNLKSATYKSAFTIVGPNLTWTLTRFIGTTQDTLVKTYPEFSGTQDTLPVIDGFMPIHRMIRDSGVVMDRNDPASLNRDLNSIDKGWDYFPPENQWLTGLDTQRLKTAKFVSRQFQSRSMSISWPYFAGANFPSFRGIRTRVVANGTEFTEIPGSDGVLQGGPLRKVQVVFGQNSQAYRYAVVENNVPVNALDRDTTLTNTPYVDMIQIPFSVFEVDELSVDQPRQLNVAIIDADGNGAWDPDTSKLGKYQIVYILASSYSATPKAYYMSRNPGLVSPASGFPSFDIMYAWMPRVRRAPNGSPMTFTNGDKLDIYPYVITRAEFVPGRNVYYTWTVKGTQIGNNEFATSNNQMDRVNVFPNPYFGHNRLETNPVDRFVTFTNLPSNCTIYIYSLNGTMIRKLLRTNTDPNNSMERWDIRNDSDIPVASGMYIAVIDAPGIGTKIVKLAIFTPEERIDTF